MALRLTSAADYAILAMTHMACLSEGAVARRSDIVRAHGLPSSFLAKILQSLVKAGLLRSNRGVDGGFVLARPASEITLLDVIEAVEGPLALAACTESPCACDRLQECAAQPVWLAVQSKMAELLRASTLEDLVSTPRRRRALPGI